VETSRSTSIDMQREVGKCAFCSTFPFVPSLLFLHVLCGPRRTDAALKEGTVCFAMELFDARSKSSRTTKCSFLIPHSDMQSLSLPNMVNTFTTFIHSRYSNDSSYKDFRPIQSMTRRAIIRVCSNVLVKFDVGGDRYNPRRVNDRPRRHVAKFKRCLETFALEMKLLKCV